jgi:asparagine synthase (glutamine-hydrolysing)
MGQQGDQHAVLMGRLYYRDELLAQMPQCWFLAESDNDAELVLAAYRHWGPAGLTRLEGDFAVVLWDARKQLLVGIRDPLGGYPLYWTSHQGVLAFGSCLRPLLGLLPDRSLNLDYLAEFLMLPGASFSELDSEHCAYEGIRRVRAGSLVQMQLPNGHLEQDTYWNWLDKMVDPGTDQLEELSDLAAERLREAVRQRSRGCVASHVSGGMDSTAVALLARDALRSQIGQPPVHAISLVFEKLGGLNRETPYLELALQQPGLVPHRVMGDDILDYDCFAEPPFHDEPYTNLRGLGLDGKLAEAAAQTGADTLLTGAGADGFWDAFPYHLADLLRQGRLGAAWKDARAWGRATNTSAWHFLWQFGLENLLPVSWLAGWGPLCRGGFASWEQQGPGTIAPWVRAEFARSHGLRAQGVAQVQRVYSSCPSMNVSLALAVLRGSIGDSCRWSVAAPRGMVLTHPFMDPRLVCLGLGILKRFRQEPGKQKPLLVHAMRDVLPDMIRNRRRKGHYNALSHAGLARNLPVLETMIRQAPVDDLNLFDKDVLLQCLHKAALGIAPKAHGLTRLDLTLAWLRWYSLQGEWQQPMTPVMSLRGSRAGHIQPQHSAILSAR